MLFFVSVNQVLVRLWARRRSRCLTGKCCLVKGNGCHAIGWQLRSEALQMRALRDGGSFCVCVLSKLACCALGTTLERLRVWMVPVHGGSDIGLRIDIVLEQEKGIRWMPWHQEAMKDVARCEKPWGAASRL